MQSKVFPGLGSEMDPGSLFGALWAHSLAWAQKSFREACLELSGLIFWRGLGNGSKRLVWNSQKPFSGLGSEMAPKVRVLAPVSAQGSQFFQKINEKIKKNATFKGILL